MNLEVQGISITLTPEQIAQIKEQQRKLIPITDRILTVSDAFKERGIDEGMWGARYASASDTVYAYALLTEIIVPAFNEGWKPDWENISQPKYTIWMEYKPGSGFSFDSCVSVRHGSPVGSHLCFKDEKVARIVAERFKDIINTMFLR